MEEIKDIEVRKNEQYKSRVMRFVSGLIESNGNYNNVYDDGKFILKKLDDRGFGLLNNEKGVHVQIANINDEFKKLVDEAKKWHDNGRALTSYNFMAHNPLFSMYATIKDAEEWFKNYVNGMSAKIEGLLDGESYSKDSSLYGFIKTAINYIDLYNKMNKTINNINGSLNYKDVALGTVGASMGFTMEDYIEESPKINEIDFEM